MVICLEHMAQVMPLPLTVSCFSKIQIGFTFLVPAHPGSPGKMAVKQVYVFDGCFSFVCAPLIPFLISALYWRLHAFVALCLIFSIPSRELGLWKRLCSVEWDIKPQLSQSMRV